MLRQERPRWCYLHGREGVPELMREARPRAPRPCWTSTWATSAAATRCIECIRLADLFVPNEAELLRLTGTDSLEAAVAAAAAWGTPMVVTRGAAGRWWSARTG